MANMDLDGDGKIDCQEFFNAAIDHQKLLNEDNIEKLFDMFDENKDGEISIAELGSAVKSDQ